MSTIVWLRQDLRVEDHPPLTEALTRGKPVIPVYIWAEEEEGEWPMGGAQKVWLHFSLIALRDELERIGLNLVIRKGKSLAVLEEIIKDTGAETVLWSRRYEPAIIERDRHIKNVLTEKGIEVKSFNSSLLFEPWNVLNKQNKPFQVFTPFWRHCLTLPISDAILPIPSKGKGVKLDSETLDLLPKIDWDEGIKHEWVEGACAAKKELKAFLNKKVADYKELRDFPSLPATSKLSPYLHFGEISPRSVFRAAKEMKNSEPFLRQLGWREFAYHLLYHFPKTPLKPLRSDWDPFKWSTSASHLTAWQKGMTGYPIVDAGMRELWATGWMHNRVRLIVGSFLVKDLHISWVKGAQWFWDTLVDADLANNTLGWQWVAGCGADAAPYFRIFNPTLQGEKFDSEGHYIKKWVPELKELSREFLHKPWEAPPLLLKAAGITLGKDYPFPLVDHAVEKEKAMVLYRSLKTDN